MKPDPIPPPRMPEPPAKPAPPAAPKPHANIQTQSAAKEFNRCDMDVVELRKLPVQVDPYRPKFGRQPSEWSPVPFTGGNEVVGYIYGRCAFNDMARALDTAYSPGHRIYLAGWWIETRVELRDPKSALPGVFTVLEEFLRGTSAQIRALLWKPPPAAIKYANNQPITDLVNGLPHGAALMDERLPRDPIFGAHHQKLLIVAGSRGLIAFTGGMDQNNSRVNVQHYEPLHDVHLRIRGPAALGLLNVFRERWMDHPDTVALDAKLGVPRGSQYGVRASVAFPNPVTARDPVPSSTFPSDAQPRADRLVAIGRTYANLDKQNNPPPYAFARPGEITAWRMVEHAIKAAKRWIYLEDQYLTSTRAREALTAKLAEKNFEYLLILVCNDRAADIPFATTWHNEYRAALQKVDPSRSKWGIFTLIDASEPSRKLWCGSYVHSKTWIFDDEYAIVGTANCTDRSFTYDTEVVAGIAEAPVNAAGGAGFARDLRIALWRKHLGVQHHLLRDYRSGLKLWRNLPPTSMAYPFSDLRTPRPATLKKPDVVDKATGKVLEAGEVIEIDPAEVDVQKVRIFVDPDGLK